MLFLQSAAYSNHLQDLIISQDYLFKGIVSRDWGGLLMILLGRLEVFNISASRFIFFLSAFSYSNFKNGRLSGASFQHNSSKDQYKSGDSNSLA